ncbi:MAG TPA: sulfotransferase domain-containing protein [Rhizomicrobium sp.]|jgi:hypothetical protein|nr:sulfotransferase domain-containing protein [Rhizomicrobium sp.]
MTTIPVTLANGRSISFEVRTGLAGPPLFLFSVRKCGSSIVNKIVRAVAHANNCNYVDVSGSFFKANILPKDYRFDEGLLPILHGGNIYGGFRAMVPALRVSPLFRESPKLLLIRDPRDALVSEYFSNAYSHPIPQTTDGHDEVKQQMKLQRETALAMPLEKYVVHRAPGMKLSMMEYRKVFKDPGTTLLKYEDYIFDKRSLMLVIAEKFRWHVDEDLIRRILEWADIRPEHENPTAFIRKVTPGDHREKLSAETISALNKILRPVLRLYNYPR